MASQTSMFARQKLQTATEEWCFLCDPCGKVKSKTVQSVRRVGGWCEMAPSLGASEWSGVGRE
jgi:hypothetical protein